MIQKMSNKIDCPYYSKRNNTCTHKRSFIYSFKTKPSCDYKDQLKCKWYMKWLDNKLKLIRELKNSKLNLSNKEMIP